MDELRIKLLRDLMSQLRAESASAGLPAPVKGHCPDCGLDLQADVVAHHQRVLHEEGMWAQIEYRILQCRGCEAVYFQEDEICSENVVYKVNPQTGEHDYPHTITHWPAPSKRKRPNWWYDPHESPHF